VMKFTVWQAVLRWGGSQLNAFREDSPMGLTWPDLACGASELAAKQQYYRVHTYTLCEWIPNRMLAPLTLIPD
jgi:hypothetical protein